MWPVLNGGGGGGGRGALLNATQSYHSDSLNDVILKYSLNFHWQCHHYRRVNQLNRNIYNLNVSVSNPHVLLVDRCSTTNI